MSFKLPKISRIITTLAFFAIGTTFTAIVYPFVEQKIAENTDYVVYEVPVIILSKEKRFKPCEKIPLKFVRTSKIETVIESYNNIVEIGGNRKVTRIATSGTLKPTSNFPVQIDYDPTCLPPGKWRIEGTFKYSYRKADKQFLWESEEFEIIN